MVSSPRHLNALRAFEAAARHQSIAKAASELNVSHSVVSQHVKNLELWFKTDLFIRYGNRIELSDDGRALLPRISSGFQTLSDACNSLLRITLGTTLIVSAEPALASLWLRKRITEFSAEHPKIEIELRSAWQPPQLGEGQADMIVHFETRVPATDANHQRLFSIDGYPACSPDLRNRLQVSENRVDWDTVPLIHDNSHDVWHQWYAACQPKSQHWQNGRVHSDLSLAIDAAVDGEGVILADDVLCKKEVESGALVLLDSRRIRCVWYCLATPRKSSRKPAIDTLKNWLMDKASAGVEV